MLSKSQIKLYKSLSQKKFRNESHLFIAEGTKTVQEFLDNNWGIEALIATDEWVKKNLKKVHKAFISSSYDEIQQLSLQKTPQEVIAIVHQKEHAIPDTLKTKLGIALDEVQDSGNVGTIIRLALWFGFDYLFLGDGTADPYSPKVVQASMGAIAKIPFYKGNLVQFLNSDKAPKKVYGTFMQGETLYKMNLQPEGLLVMGNEGNGISHEVEKKISHRIFIPPYPDDGVPIDSLNVATATAIICAEFRRNIFLNKICKQS